MRGRLEAALNFPHGEALSLGPSVNALGAQANRSSSEVTVDFIAQTQAREDQTDKNNVRNTRNGTKTLLRAQRTCRYRTAPFLHHGIPSIRRWRIPHPLPCCLPRLSLDSFSPRESLHCTLMSLHHPNLKDVQVTRKAQIWLICGICEHPVME